MSDTTKPEKCASIDETMDSTTKSCEYLSDDKALKKKLKKVRQKMKMNSGTPKTESVPEIDVNNESERFLKIEQDKRRAFVNVDDRDTNNSSKSEVDDESTDINHLTMSSAFVQSIVNKNNTVKMPKKNDTPTSKDSFKDADHKRNTLFTDDSDGFSCVKKSGQLSPITFCKTPEGFGNEALRIIPMGHYQLAINYLSRAIALDPTDYRHHFNRSYCYLRVGNFSSALADIQYASEHSSDITELSQAKCREGQAYCGLQNYEAAEQAFNESMNLAPDYLYAHREMKRMQVLQMVYIGFNEQDALLALQKYPNTTEAINLLVERAPTNTANYDSTGNGTEDDDELFYSDSEDNPSNERLMSKIINYDPNIPEEPEIYKLPPSNDILNKLRQPSRASSPDRALRVFKAVITPTKPRKSNHGIDDKSIWVGSLTPLITEAMIRNRFERFGKVVSVWMSPDKNYGFVHFQYATGPQKAFAEAKYNGGCIDLNGSKLIIKEKPMKTNKMNN